MILSALLNKSCIFLLVSGSGEVFFEVESWDCEAGTASFAWDVGLDSVCSCLTDGVGRRGETAVSAVASLKGFVVSGAATWTTHAAVASIVP